MGIVCENCGARSDQVEVRLLRCPLCGGKMASNGNRPERVTKIVVEGFCPFCEADDTAAHEHRIIDGELLTVDP